MSLAVPSWPLEAPGKVFADSKRQVACAVTGSSSNS